MLKLSHVSMVQHAISCNCVHMHWSYVSEHSCMSAVFQYGNHNKITKPDCLSHSLQYNNVSCSKVLPMSTRLDYCQAKPNAESLDVDKYLIVKENDKLEFVCNTVHDQPNHRCSRVHGLYCVILYTPVIM